MPIRQVRSTWPLCSPSARSSAYDMAPSSSPRSNAASARARDDPASHGHEVHDGGRDHEGVEDLVEPVGARDRKSTRLNSSHLVISYAVFCLKKKKKILHSSRISTS